MSINPLSFSKALLISGMIVFISFGCSKTDETEMLVLGGTILTLDPSQPEVEAMVVRDGKVEAVGIKAELETRFPKAQRHDLEGRTVLPGFIDSHTHVYALAHDMKKVDLAGTLTIKEMTEKLRAHHPDPPEGQWLIGANWDEGEWGSRGYPDRAELDEAFPNNPVYLESLHGFAGFYNGRALEIAGIGPETPDPEVGEILRRPNGEPTGTLLTRAQDLVNKHIPPESLEETKETLLLGMNLMAKEGVTSIHEAGMGKEMVQAFSELREEGRLPIRVYGMLSRRNKDLMEEWFKRGPWIDPEAFFTVRSIKVFYDGSLGSRTAILKEPYSDEPEGANMTEYISSQELTSLSSQALEKGFQMVIHAIGDGANDRVLSIFEKVLKSDPSVDHRWRIEHAQVVLPDFYMRCAAQHIISSMQSSHAVEDRYWAEDRVGPERIRHAYAWRRMLDAGVFLLMNSDLPAVPWKPLYTLYFAVTRKDLNGNPPEGWYPDQILTVEETLYAMTLAGAYAAFQEDQLGSLSPGKFADFVELDKDPRHAKPEELKNIKVLRTWVAGKVVSEIN
ncbi:MAG: amidohydrolase [Candidatus Aminicenantes bacterium]|nr:MAG: amidohydrolase [Candidatus Aminicenantes bacterium]